MDIHEPSCSLEASDVQRRHHNKKQPVLDLLQAVWTAHKHYSVASMTVRRFAARAHDLHKADGHHILGPTVWLMHSSWAIET
eukprot:3424941-Amphidinium_carterae.2